ncbi:spore germination protein KA [Geosporobacter subterraneus DSM 17957]|uniref:Spore germination protein KA n=1 Tax=Geosporobacter subterraneus DSM 17957 TaxID=1121919 RepID=A0A1M6PBM6_9FIRM|nr:spore germination protein [Geosporobacter subterraneus]SHK05343.1 spore germination protein KA [Geosporobacter subterraneus DSM 17957]
MKGSMFDFVKGILSRAGNKKHKVISIDNHLSSEDLPLFFSDNIDRNIEMLHSLTCNSDDMVFKTFHIATLPSMKAVVVFIENLIDSSILETSTLSPLTIGIGERPLEERTLLSSDVETLIEKILLNIHPAFLSDVKQSMDAILKGNGILLINGYPKAISIDISRLVGKKYAEPKAEKAIKGPQEGFVEDININTAMIRRKIKSSHLAVKALHLGRESNSEIRIVYMDNISHSSIVEELLRRLNRINVDGIMSSSNIEEYITDAPTSLFPTTFYTERPDRVAPMLLEGRVAIICDGSPFVIVVPAIISDFFITTEDYYQNYYFSTLNRLLGYGGAVILAFLPSVYIAVITFHQEVIPTRLALTLAGTKAGVPYPAFVEALLMEVAFEALREAGIRLPTHLGQAVSIVGALIIGQAAVEAGLVSPAVVIVVAATAIFSFTMPYSNFTLSLRIIRFFNMALAATLGIYGIMTGALIIALHLISLRSFGVPFMVPFAPVSLQDMKDWILRFPQWAITKRSSHIIKNNINKKTDRLKPHSSINERKEYL